MGVAADDLVQAAKNYAEARQIRGTQPLYILNAENFLRKLKFDEYLPEKYKKPKPPKRQHTSVDQYNQFMKHDYDMDSLGSCPTGEVRRIESNKKIVPIRTAKPASIRLYHVGDRHNGAVKTQTE